MADNDNSEKWASADGNHFAKAPSDMFEGKVCHITGGTSGLGKALANASAKEGCKVVITGRRADKGEEVVSSIKNDGGEAFFTKCDASDPAQVQASVKATIEKYGSLDYAFNNADVITESEWTGGPHQITLHDWKKPVDTNLKAVANAMFAHNIIGSLVNCASIYAKNATKLGTAYTATEHSLVGLTKSEALVFAKKGIRVNTECPTYSSSEMTAMLEAAEKHGAKTASDWNIAGRWLKNSEVVDGVHWLWSHQSSCYSGQAFVLDSGFTATWVPPDAWEETHHFLIVSLSAPFSVILAAFGIMNKVGIPMISKGLGAVPVEFHDFIHSCVVWQHYDLEQGAGQ